MAADGVNKLSLTLIHGQHKHVLTLELPDSEAGNILTVDHLAAQVEKLTGVPIQGQRLIYKGKSLKGEVTSLKQLGLKNGCKIMVIGKKFNLEDDVNMQEMKRIESDIEKTEKKFHEIIHESDGIHRGHLPEHLHEPALNKLSRRLGSCMEEFTRLMEHLDALTLADAGDEIKQRRKSLISRIQVMVNRGDGIRAGLDEMSHRLNP